MSLKEMNKAQYSCKYKTFCDRMDYRKENKLVK